MSRRTNPPSPAVLGKRTQKLLKAIHLAFAGLWLGGLASIALLLAGKGPFADDAAIAAHSVHETVIFAAFTGTLATGLVYGLWTRWGFFVHDWISIKWVLALVLFGLTLGYQSPSLSGLAALADAGLPRFHGLALADFRRQSLVLVLTQIALVLGVFVVSTVRPFSTRKPPTLPRAWQVGGLLTLALLGAGFGLWNAWMLRGYRTMEIANIGAANLADGHYIGRAVCGLGYEVDVTVRQGRIVATEARDRPDNHYALLAETVLTRIVNAQTPNVDAITGATTSSKCMMRAVEQALRGATAGHSVPATRKHR